MKAFNLSNLLKLYLPSLFFIVLFAMGAFGSSLLWVNIVAGSIALLILGNVFLQNKIINRILGIIFLLGSCYMMLALGDDYVDGEATKGYLVGLFLVLFSATMSVLLIIGYKKNPD